MIERKWVELLYPTRHIFVERNGISYVIHEVPPLMQYDGDKNFFNTPDEPHVVEISDFSLFTSRDGKVETLIRAANSSLRALEIHGEWSRGRWFPAGKRFKHAGITIPDIVEDYEKASKKKD